MHNPIVIAATVLVLLIVASYALMSVSGMKLLFHALFATEYGLEVVCGDALPILFAASNQLQVLSPQAIESGLIDPATGKKVPGVPWGLCGPGNAGGLLMWDEIQMWQRGMVANCNSVTFGKPGTRKSTGNKFALFVNAVIGYNQLVVDRTGEYTLLVRLINRFIPGAAEILRVSTDPETKEPPNVFINPMDPELDLEEVRYPLITALVLIAMGKTTKQGYRNELTNEEDALLWRAIEEVDQDYADGKIDVPLLSHIQAKLKRPSAKMVELIDKEEPAVREMASQMYLAVYKLTEGKLKGTFHKPTTPGILQPRRLLVLNCAGVKDERVVITTLILNYYIMSQLKGPDAPPSERVHRVELDELWDMLAHPGMVDSLRIFYKQSGKLGVHVNSTMHNEQDAEVGTDITAIEGLFADSDIRRFYRMNRNQLESRQKLLGLNDEQVNIIAGTEDGSRKGLREGQCLLVWGEHNSLIVEQRVWDVVLPACDTRWMMRKPDTRVTELPRAQEQLQVAV
jgi:hypothetical protein